MSEIDASLQTARPAGENAPEPEFVEETLQPGQGMSMEFLCHNCQVKVAIVCSPQRTPKFCNFCGKRVEPVERFEGLDA